MNKQIPKAPSQTGIDAPFSQSRLRFSSSVVLHNATIDRRTPTPQIASKTELVDPRGRENKLKTASMIKVKAHTNKMRSTCSFGLSDKIKAVKNAAGADTKTINAMSRANGEGPSPGGIEFIDFLCAKSVLVK
jgi:hypothetical protein